MIVTSGPDARQERSRYLGGPGENRRDERPFRFSITRRFFKVDPIWWLN